MCEINGDWWLYRYSISRHVLKAAETELKIASLPDGACQAIFEMSGFDLKHKVEMNKTNNGSTTAAGADAVSWVGEKGCFDFRWDFYPDSGILLGYAADRSNDAYRDIFIAVRSRLSQQLDNRDQYDFQGYCFTPLTRNKPAEKEASTLHIDLRDGKREMTQGYDGADLAYAIVRKEDYGYGLRIIGEEQGSGSENILRRRLALWILPVDPARSDCRLVIGYYFGMLPSEITETVLQDLVVFSKPGPECNLGIHACCSVGPE
jgi:hypothetical protein